MRYRAIFSDLDGTIVPNRADGLPSYKVVEAIRKATKRVFVCLATSRPLFMAQKIIDVLPLNGLCILNDATQIYDPTQKKIVETLFLSPESIRESLVILAKQRVSLLVNDGLRDWEYKGEALNGEISTLLVPDVKPEMADDIITELTHISNIAVQKIPSYTKGLTWVSITNPQATKLHGVVRVAELLGISPKQAVGIGDGYNDYPLLSACGLKIAMGNAVPELKAIADFIAPSVEEDGVATVIEKFIL